MFYRLVLPFATNFLQGKWKFFQQKTFIRIPGFRPHPLSPLRPAWCLLLGRSSCNLRRISSIATKPSLRDSMFRWSKVYAYTILDSLSEIWNQICAKHLFGRGRMKSQWYLARYNFNRPNYHVQLSCLDHHEENQLAPWRLDLPFLRTSFRKDGWWMNSFAWCILITSLLKIQFHFNHAR